MKLLIKKGLVADPSTGKLGDLDVLIDGSTIREVRSHIEDGDALIIDAEGKWVVPGLVDVHVHLREPGQEYKENIYTGSRAAAAGGFTTVIAEPNTNPPIDSPTRLKNLIEIAKKQSVVNFFSKACITRGIQGEELTDIEKLKEAGAIAISDDGHPVPGERMMQNALIEGEKHNILASPHCEESDFYRKREREKQEKKDQAELFSMPYSPGTEPYTSEEGFVKRDIELAKESGAHVHISHVSFAGSVKKIAEAKKKGIRVTTEAAPHHFLLTEEMGKEIGPNAKVNPPLRTKEDVDAIKKGLADGTIDIIASDHAPHSSEEKNRSWEQAPFGIIGLETTLGLVLTYLVKPGILTMNQAVEKLAFFPAKIFGLMEKNGIGTLTSGAGADITIIDPEKEWKVDVSKFYSKARNCPFDGWKLQGKAITTIVQGQIVMKDGNIVANGKK